ncbi:MAG: exosome non-catalytic core subunit rrp46 [Thelocarpon superellum]|nr:MAG: exosome non-catalytic core subunit rrp46 [Thelocarpon superellum]
MTETNDHAETAISHLSRADGSATFSQGGYSIIAAVNGPVEALRRDELPEEAVVDVMLRPASGAGAPMPQGSYILDPSSKQCEEASSAHVLAFTSQGALLLAESEGDFDLDQWEEVFDRAKSACCGPSNAKGDEDALMEDESPDPMPRQQMLRDVMRAKVARDQSWKESLQHVAVDG